MPPCSSRRTPPRRRRRWPGLRPCWPWSKAGSRPWCEAAAATGCPQADALAEAIRRRRATGGPAERTFATLVGLELRPRRLREAAAIWRGLTDARGIAGREAIWSHPDLLPTTEDLDDPEGFVRGRPELDISDLEAEGRALDDDSAQGEPAPEDEKGTQDGRDSISRRGPLRW